MGRNTSPVFQLPPEAQLKETTGDDNRGFRPGWKGTSLSEMREFARKRALMLGVSVIHDNASRWPRFPLGCFISGPQEPTLFLMLSPAQLIPRWTQPPPVARAGSLDRQSHPASRDLSKLFAAPLSASQSQKVLPAKDLLSLSLSRRDQGSQRQPKVEDAVGATLSRSWQENTEPYSSWKPHKLHIFRKTDRNWKLQLCLIGGEEQKENLAPRRNAERGNASSALEPLLRLYLL